MNLVGMVASDEGTASRIEAVGEDYEGALVVLKGMVPEGCKLISIRVDR